MMDRFTPADNPRAFRDALGRFATGVTVVIAPGDEGPIGITANSFASLSLTPPLVLWSPAKQSTRHDAFITAETFNLHILANDQQTLCDAFVRSKHGFDGLVTDIGLNGLPVLSGCLAVFECRKYAVHDAGDHSLIIGKVTHASERPGAPLIFQNGAFGTGAN